MDALLLGMASQIAEREDHVVVEDVRGEAEAVPAGCAPLAPGSRISWSSRARQVGGMQSWELALLLAKVHLLWLMSLWGWLEPWAWTRGAMVVLSSLRLSVSHSQISGLGH